MVGGFDPIYFEDEERLTCHHLDEVLALLPALGTPTISTLADESWVDVTTVVDDKTVRDLLPQLKEAGARGIIETPLNKLID